ncbi:GAF and ANTAR domain-containing protein [Streptosporangium lutulentum]|uniref:Transcriptional regulator with GAF, ATPase, and Fis domain n=1 Tax=Streptosporangium lutulentum TaxID=1461250 RepID=A0ABT9QF50_9ACTN|nr:GAF and ANTAR domain-containing protein [Streptosporangium lutulentum]MDP9844569.1 transcriptional regulator with GAF, ATPase, and Fis domain [Streptosporangium lutulentum]
MLDRRTAQTFVELADTLVVGFDVIDLLQTLAERCVDLLDVDAAGILLADQRGSLTLVAASTEQARLLELFQLQDEEGPCLDCYHSGQMVTCSNLAAHPQQWPRFTTAAHHAGFAAVQAFPLRLRDQVLGAMNLFSSAPGVPSPENTSVAQALADVATIGITHERTLREHQLITEQLQHALNSRIVIEQAKGMLAERGQIDVGEAFILLRAYARNHNQQLSAIARQVINQDAIVAELMYIQRSSPIDRSDI